MQWETATLLLVQTKMSGRTLCGGWQGGGVGGRAKLLGVLWPLCVRTWVLKNFFIVSRPPNP